MKYDQYAQIDLKPDSMDFQCQNTLLKESDLDQLKSKLRDEVREQMTLEMSQRLE